MGVPAVDVTLDYAEFRCRHLVDGQRVGARVQINYVPHQHLIPPDKLRTYLEGIEDDKGSPEWFAAVIAADLMRVAQPHRLTVKVTFARQCGVLAEVTVPLMSPQMALRQQQR